MDVSELVRRMYLHRETLAVLPPRSGPAFAECLLLAKWSYPNFLLG
jgi:hypothetical protein